jgi:ketosteroid isomerase-like protein
MRAMRFAAALIAVIFLRTATLHAETNVDLVARVRAAEAGFAKTMADRDLEAFKSFLDQEAIFFSGAGSTHGADAIAGAWAPFFEGEDAPFSWKPEEVQVLGSGKLALSSGPVYGSTGERIGSLNSIWRLDEDGQWKVVFDKGCD